MRPWFAAFLIVTLSAPLIAGEPAPTPPAKPLYTRLGGLSKIAELGDTFAQFLLKEETVLANAEVKKALDGYPPAALKYHLTSALAQLSGGPERFTGPALTDLKTTLKFGDAEWKGVVAALSKAMAFHKIPDAEAKDLLTASEDLAKTILDMENRTFRNKEKAFSLVVPAGWERKENVDGAALVAYSPKADAKDVFLEQIRVFVEDLPVDMTPVEYLKSFVLQANRQLKDFKVQETVSVRISDEPAEVLVYTYKADNASMMNANYFVVKNKKAYVVSSIADEAQFAAYKNVFLDAIKTFRLE